MISVIIRTRNEAAWISRCLSAVTAQSYHAFEIIVVDNASTDATRDILKRFDCQVVEIGEREFTYGRALNAGISASCGEYLAILSGHCVPLNDQWLQCLRASFDDSRVAGVYGRQEPLPDTDPVDKRDLWTSFGIERRLQRKEIFFHNANSMVRRDVWERFPFDEEIAGVEDRDWAKKVLSWGHRIVYEPSASVYHYHGIHHGQDARRAERVVRVIELIQSTQRR